MAEKKNPDDQKMLKRFAGVGVQMAVVIGGFTWLGHYLDERQHNKTAIWTIILSLTGVFVAMYLIFKEVKRMNDSNP